LIVVKTATPRIYIKICFGISVKNPKSFSVFVADNNPLSCVDRLPRQSLQVIRYVVGSLRWIHPIYFREF